MAIRKTLFVSSIFAVLLGAQQNAAVAPAPPIYKSPFVNSAYRMGNYTFSGVTDISYNWNSNHPGNNVNPLRAFDMEANGYTLNMALFSLERTKGPVGFRVEGGGGSVIDSFYLAEPRHAAPWTKYLLQGYVSFRPESWNGVTVDFGKFYTNAGAEVTNTSLNWNYSRSLLFNFGPFYHFGVRAAVPVSKEWTVGGQLVNGWNTINDNNSGKTGAFTTAYTKGKVVWANSYYFGPEKTDNNSGFRHFWDTALTVTASDNAAFSFNYDYGIDRGANGGPGAMFTGFSGNARFAFGRFALAPRYEWYKDRDGLITGTAQTLQEATITGDLRVVDGMSLRMEYRRDWSDQNFFPRGDNPGVFGHQNTLMVGFVFSFNPPPPAP
ncbi:MAG: porin [Bryobacter sp.]|jgi:hypothetical protein|nr:porin [Bryobacter sp.]